MVFSGIVRVIVISLLVKSTPSLHCPLKGGLPVKVTVTVSLEQPVLVESVAVVPIGPTTAVPDDVPSHVESANLTMEYEPDAVTVREVWKAVVENVAPSDHAPVNGGVPWNFALTVTRLHSTFGSATVATGLSQVSSLT